MSLRSDPRAANPFRQSRKGTARPSRASLALETLEDRLAPAVFNVNSLADILNPGPGVVTLRSAIQQANATPGAHTINLTVPGTYKITLAGSGEDANATGDFDILAAGGNLTIVNTSGRPVAIDGGGLDRVFDINPTFDPNNPGAPFKVTLQGLTIQHGIAAPFGDGTMGGGAIRDTGNASLELDNVVIANNSASGAGGGILMQNTVNTPWTLTVNNSVIRNNHAGDAGGGIDTIGSGHVIVTASQLIGNTCVNQGAAIWLDMINNASATLTMTNSLVSRNYAYAGPTGALGTAGNGAVTIVGTTVSDNYSGSTGGGYGDENKLANLTVSNSLFLNNVAMTDGGGIQAGGDGTTVTITNTAFVGNTAGGKGGGLFASGGAVTITGSRFSENTAVNGGGIEDQAATLALSTSQLDNNRAVGDANGNGGAGGGIDAQTGVTGVTVANSLFLNNSASNGATPLGGGGILQITGTLAVTNSQFTGNTTSGFGGGGLNFGGTVLTVTGSTFNNNRATEGGGLFFAGGGPMLADSTVTNDTFVGNASSTNGGGITAFASGNLVLTSDTINGNTTAGNGGGVALVGGGHGIPSFQNTIVALNTAAGMGPDVFTATGVTVTDNGGNFIGTLAGSTGFNPGTLTGNPQLGPLQNNGGRFAGLPGHGQVVQTEAVLPGSPALNRGVAGLLTTDARGFPRPGANPSIGAFEPQFNLGTSPNQVFVESLYETLLNRTADPGAAGWVAQLNQGLPRSSVVSAIEASAEYRNIQVQALYQRYLHRQADTVGLSNFVNALGAGFTVEQVAAILVGSGEYFQLHGSNNVSFLDAVYLDALDRLPDPTGQDAFSQALAGGMSRQAVASLIFGSQEYLGNLVESEYQSLLGRPSDPNGLAAFTQALQRGLTDQALVAIMLGSPEAFAKRS
jgi:hypothetical protein